MSQAENRGNSPTRGRHDAAVVLIEFADYECPYCRKVHPELKKLQQEFGDNAVMAFKDFPLPAHPHAEKTAEAARCADAQAVSGTSTICFSKTAPNLRFQN